MIKIEDNIPSEQEMQDWFERYLEPKRENALSVAEDVPSIVIDQAVNRNQDKNGETMPPKKKDDGLPPLNSKRNESDPHMMSFSRWTFTEIDKSSLRINYSPPAYFKYVVQNGREWISKTKWNPEAKKRILLKMLRNFLYGS